jgi:hypothetical protein
MKRRNLFLLLAATFIIAAISPNTTYASDKTSVPSAYFAGRDAQTQTLSGVDNRAKILKTYLERYNSPLAEHADTLVKEADTYNLDWKLVAAISGVESGYGQMIPPYSYNGWGFNVYDNNVRGFASWDEGITVVSKALREEYMDARGAKNVYEIGATYAADPSWAYKVTNYMNEIDSFQAETNNTTVSISL